MEAQDLVKRYFHLRRQASASGAARMLDVIALFVAAIACIEIVIHLVFTGKFDREHAAMLIFALAVRAIFGVHGLVRRGVIPCDARHIEHGLTHLVMAMKTTYLKMPVQHWVVRRVSLLPRNKTWGINLVPILEKSLTETMPEISTGLPIDQEMDVVEWTSSFHYNTLIAHAIIVRWFDTQLEYIRTELHLPLAQIEYSISRGEDLAACLPQLRKVIGFVSNLFRVRNAVALALMKRPGRVTRESITAYTKAVLDKAVEVCGKS